MEITIKVTVNTRDGSYPSEYKVNMELIKLLDQKNISWYDSALGREICGYIITNQIINN